MTSKMANKNQNHIPIVHESRVVTGDGILTDRQNAWVHGPPNDIYKENPVIYKHKVEEEIKKKTKSQSHKESIKVRGLTSEGEDSSQHSHGILQKIQVSRKERHEAAMEEMIQELAGISLDLEPQIQEVCTTIKTYLEDDSKEIEQLMAPILDDVSLVTYSLNDLHNIWASVEKHSTQRTAWINDLNDHLEHIEQKRSSLICDVLKSYTLTFERVAHLMPGDVHRLMEEEIMTINTSIIGNQEATADLSNRLLIADIESEKNWYVKFQNRIEDWKEFKLEEYVEKHKHFMEGETIADCPTLKRHISDLVNQQTSLNNRRVDLLGQLTEMRPPSSTKPAVYQWNQAVTNVTGELDQLHSKYILLVKVEQEKILHQCDTFLQTLQKDMFNQGIATEDEVDELFNERFHPPVGELKSKFEYEMDTLTRHLFEVMAHQKQHLKRLFRFAHGLAGVWDEHEIGLAKEERHLQEMLDKNRKDHDYQNQLKEAKLDIVIDRMRQGSNEESLAAGLRQSLHMLEDIKKGYMEFHATQKSIGERYPKMVKDEGERYSSAVTNYLNVVHHAHVKEMSNREIIKTVTLSNGSIYHFLAPLYDAPSTASGTRGSLSQPSPSPSEGGEDIKVEVFSYVESFAISDGLFEKLMHEMGLAFLEHLEMWMDDVVVRANAVMAAKVEEIHNELDLRLHLHEARPGRVENDVHQVRGTELTLHRERVLQHCTGIDHSLDSLKKSFHKMIEEHLKENEMFKISVEELEGKFVQAASTHDLKSHQDEVHGKLDHYMNVIRASVRYFRYDLDNMLNKVRNSNAEFRKSLKIFSEGGNFSPEEVDEYRKNLEKVASKIDACEGSLVGELEGMETKRMEVARDYAGKLEERFKQHLFDLTFVEKMKRWLTNIQVKIKGEVANSNSQSQHLSKMISVLSRRVELVMNPSADGESYSSEALHETLMPLVVSIRERVTYLNCALSKESYQNTIVQDEETKVEIPRETSKTPKSSRRKTRYTKKSQSSPGGATGQRSNHGIKGHTENRDKDRTLTKSKSPNEEKERKASTKDQAAANHESLDLSRGSSVSMGMDKRQGMARTQFGGKYDKRYLIFGENTGENEVETHFLPLQLRILQTGLDGLLSTAELYYRQRGARAATRPQLINDTFDACAESLGKRLTKYKEQTETFHNDSVQEFRAQIRLFIGCVEKLPSIMMTSVDTRFQLLWAEKMEEIHNAYDNQKRKIEKRKLEHQTLLRPTLGHPNNQKEFQRLCGAETARQKEAAEMIERYERLMRETELQTAEEFFQELQNMTVLLFSQFDTIVTVDDIIVGIAKIQPKSEKQLLKDKLLGKTKEKKEGSTSDEPSPMVVWGSVETSSLVMPNEMIVEKAKNCLQSVTSVKKTTAHEAVVKARDASLLKYCEVLKRSESELLECCMKARTEEERWIEHWNTSVEKIYLLY